MATTRFAFTPESAHFPTANYAALTATNDRPVLAFDAATDETAYWTFAAPQGLAGALSVIVHLFGNAAGTNSTYWQAQLEAITPGDALALQSATSFDSANAGNVAMPATQGHQTTVSITLTNDDGIAAGDYVRLSLNRDADHASDSFAADAYVTLVELREA